MAPWSSTYLSELGYVYRRKKQWQRSRDLFTRAAEGGRTGKKGQSGALGLRRAGFGMA
jgi:hypothetical protein